MAKEIDESKQGQSLVLQADNNNTKKLYIESYGCQMNFSDSEIVASILSKVGYNTTDTVDDADLVLINTCSVREKAEQTIRKLGTVQCVQAQETNDESGRIGLYG